MESALTTHPPALLDGVDARVEVGAAVGAAHGVHRVAAAMRAHAARGAQATLARHRHNWGAGNAFNEDFVDLF